MHWDAMSAYGNKYVKTPHMDQLAADGYSFRASYTPMPQCCPARASWYTGRMSCETGVPANGCELLPELPDLGQWLRKHGDYETIYAGKWHIPGRATNKGFKVICGSGQGEFSDGAVARACMGFLENYKGDKPFFLNAGFMNPHDCCYTSGASGGVGKFALAEEMLDNLPPVPENFEVHAKHAHRLKGWKEKEWRYYRYAYYRLVEMVDAEIGRLYSALKSSRFAENTVVIFVADHGDGLAFHGNITKGYMEEEAWRVPMILIHPGHVKGGQVDNEHLSIGVDISATICDYAQAPALPKMTIGKSLRPLAEGKKVSDWHEYIVGESFLGKGQVGVRDEKHKTIFYCDGPMKVYDLVADPLEMKDLSETPTGKTVVAKHREHLREYLGKVELCEKVPTGKAGAAFNNYLNYYRNLQKGA
jgi:arylsulfatase A-like enzyme